MTPHEEKAEELAQNVFEALGAASMAWSPRPGNQVFDSEEATRIGNILLEKICAITGFGSLPETLDEKDVERWLSQ
jgi:hypothetical protein